jgi:hypothetical protein
MHGEAVQTKRQVVARIQGQRDQLRALGVRRLGLFGSFARDDARPGRDVDVLVEFEPGLKNFDNFMSLAFLLEDMLGRRVEVVTPDSLSPYLRPYILKMSRSWLEYVHPTLLPLLPIS